MASGTRKEAPAEAPVVVRVKAEAEVRAKEGPLEEVRGEGGDKTI